VRLGATERGESQRGEFELQSAVIATRCQVPNR